MKQRPSTLLKPRQAKNVVSKHTGALLRRKKIEHFRGELHLLAMTKAPVLFLYHSFTCVRCSSLRKAEGRMRIGGGASSPRRLN